MKNSVCLEKFNLEQINNVLILIVIVLLLGMIFQKYYERFSAPPACANSSINPNNNVSSCTGSNQGTVVNHGGMWYKCGDRNGVGFACN